METIDQITALSFIGDRKIATQVDYQICACCGFRLMRIETTIISDQHLKVKHCPICEQFDNQDPNDLRGILLTEDRHQYFDNWLGTHGLDRETLAIHYHLNVDDFFEK